MAAPRICWFILPCRPDWVREHDEERKDHGWPGPEGITQGQRPQFTTPEIYPDIAQKVIFQGNTLFYRSPLAIKNRRITLLTMGCGGLFLLVGVLSFVPGTHLPMWITGVVFPVGALAIAYGIAVTAARRRINRDWQCAILRDADCPPFVELVSKAGLSLIYYNPKYWTKEGRVLRVPLTKAALVCSRENMESDSVHVKRMAPSRCFYDLVRFDPDQFSHDAVRDENGLIKGGCDGPIGRCLPGTLSAKKLAHWHLERV